MANVNVHAKTYPNDFHSLTRVVYLFEPLRKVYEKPYGFFLPVEGVDKSRWTYFGNNSWETVRPSRLLEKLGKEVGNNFVTFPSCWKCFLPIHGLHSDNSLMHPSG